MPTKVTKGQLTLADMNDVVSSPTQPTNPIEGTLWWNTTEKKLYVYSNGEWKFSADGLDIGGTNLWLKSSVNDSYSLWGVGDGVKSLENTFTWNGKPTIKFIKGSVSAGGISNASVRSGLPANTQFTYSFMAYSNTACSIHSSSLGHMQVVGTSDSTNVHRETSITYTPSTLTANKWTRVVITFKTPVEAVAGETFTFRSYLWYLTYGATFYFADFKLEKGNIATDWTPAPEDAQTQIDLINSTLGNMANDSILDYSERQIIKDRLTELIGYVIADTATTLPTTATNDAGTSGKGSFYYTRRNAIASGLSVTHASYVDVSTKYESLRTYLEALTPIDAWDLRTANQATNITVDKATFRAKWLDYYKAEQDLANVTADQLKKNVDNVAIGGTNYASNGDFSIALDSDGALWKVSYVGQVKEIIDISAEAPPFKYAFHVKSTTNSGGGIFTPTLWINEEANALVGKQISMSYWLKYSGITQGVNGWNLGRFGELIIEGENASGAKVYSYPMTGLGNYNYVSGTNTTWQKVTGVITISLPPNAVKLTKIMFKHGLEACVGEFWTTGIKVEIGNKATDWSPSPIDMNKRLTDVEFKITDEAIISTVTSNSNGLVSKTDLANMSTANLLRDSMFQYFGTSEMTWDYTSSGYVELDTVEKYEGTNTIRFQITGYTSSMFESLFSWDAITSQNGRYSTLSVYVMTKDKSPMNGKIKMRMVWFDSANVEVGETYKDILPADLENNVWKRFHINCDMPSNASHGQVEFMHYGNGTAWIARPMLQLGNSIPAPWVLHVEDMATTLKTQIKQTSTNVDIVVNRSTGKIKATDIVSEINLQPEAIKISSKNLELSSVVKFTEAGSVNLMPISSFGIYPTGSNLPSPLAVVSGTINTTSTKIMSSNGFVSDRLLALYGTTGAVIKLGQFLNLTADKVYIFSFYMKSSTTGNKLKFKAVNALTPTTEWGVYTANVTKINTWERYYFSFTPTGSSVGDIRIELLTSNQEMQLDGFQLELAMTGQTTPSLFKIGAQTFIHGGTILTGSITANQIKTGELVVGTNVSMGANATITWGNVTGAPTIPNSTYIDANGIYTGSITAGQITAGSISADRISGGTISGVTINVATDINVGNNINLGAGSGDYSSYKAIKIRGSDTWIYSPSGTASLYIDTMGALDIRASLGTVFHGAVSFTDATVTGLTATFG